MNAAPSKRPLKGCVKPGKGRSLSSKLWLERQLNDPYVARAKREGFRSRAAFKLIEIDDKHHGLGGGARAGGRGGGAGCGVGPNRSGDGGRVVAIDVLPMDPVVGVTFAQLDFLDPNAPEKLKAM